MRLLLIAVALLIGGAKPASAAGPELSPRTVLVLDQSEPNSPWGAAFRAALRSSLIVPSAAPIAMYVEVLDLGRFKGPQYEELLRNFLREKYRDKPVGVIVTLGSSALQLLLRLRGELWPGVPVVFAAVDEAAATQLVLSPEITGTIIRMPLRNAVAAARALVPGLKRIALVGDPLERQPFFSHFKQELQELTADLEFVDFQGLPMAELRARVAALPDDAAILYTAIYVDGAGVTYIPREALQAVAEVANRPIVVNSELQIGFGGTGGFVLPPEPVAHDSARRALRILGGESASSIPIAVGDFTKPVFDGRELKRWNVSEASLPPGSEIRFREISAWEQYRWQAIAVLTALLFQAAMISGLLIERHRRRAAEMESRRHLLEVMHLNRTAAAGVLSASIAHELNQPLGAILANAETAELLLAQDQPDQKQLQEIVADIRDADQRAGEIIKGLRRMLKRADEDLQTLDANDTIRGALHILHAEAANRGFAFSTSWAPGALPVRADQVQLQQVILNLAINGMDAMATCAPGDRILAFQTALTGDELEVSILDRGTGIPNDKLKDIFKTFYTTKQQGTGLGLSIARTIVESYGGKIWAENRNGRGAAVRFTLPLTKARAA